jgi:hypothetical protein
MRTIELPDLHLSLSMENGELVIKSLGYSYVFVDLKPDEFETIYRRLLAELPYSFAPIYSDGQTVKFTPLEAAAVSQHVLLSLLQMHLHHNVPEKITAEEMRWRQCCWTVLQHAEEKYGREKPESIALAAATVNEPLESFAQWARVERDRLEICNR